MEHERDAFHRVVRSTLARSPDQRGGGFDPNVSPIAHPFATPPLLLDRPHGQPKTDILWIPVRERFAVRVRAIVTRSAGGPAHVFRRTQDRRTRDAYDRLLPNPSNQSGTLIMLVSASATIAGVDRCGRRFTTPLRASVVSALARNGRCLPAETREARATSDTPVVLRSAELPRGRSSNRDRLAAHRVNDTWLPRPGVPSPFSSRGAPRREPLVNLSAETTRLRVWPQRERCRSLGHRGGDATQHVIRSHSATLGSSHAIVGALAGPPKDE
jgi:hypothetical protein